MVQSYLTNRQQFTTVSNKRSELSSTEFGMSQGSILGLLLFLIYINNLSNANNIFISHFADDTNILYVSSLKDVNKKIDHNLSNLIQLLRTNKISVNVTKTKRLIFKSHSKQITNILTFAQVVRKLYPKITLNI